MERHEVLTLAVAVAGYMDGDWTAKAVGEHGIRIEREDGAAVGFYLDTYRKRIRLSGSYPRQARGGGDYGPYNGRTNISVSPTRAARAIAGEITRRLLPEYLPLFAAALVKQKEDEARSGQADELAATVARILHTDRLNTQGDRITLYPDMPSGSRVTFEVDRHGGTKVDLTTSDAVLVQAIARLLANHKRIAASQEKAS